MKILTNSTGKKEVMIRQNGEKSVIALYSQVYQGESQVLESKFFSSIKNAEKWAAKILN